MLEWVAKIKFHAHLTPSNQLKSYAYNDDLFQSPDQPPMVAPRRNIGGHDVANRMSHASSVFTTSDDLEQHELDYSRDHAELRHTIQVHPGSSGYTETLMYKEHTSSNYQPMERSVSPRNQQNGEFITWVESNQQNQPMNTPDGRSTSASVVSTPSNYDDSDSIKSSSKRKGFGSLFKRGSKHSK